MDKEDGRNENNDAFAGSHDLLFHNSLFQQTFDPNNNYTDCRR